jgi:hypothetical protein
MISCLAVAAPLVIAVALKGRPQPPVSRLPAVLEADSPDWVEVGGDWTLPPTTIRARYLAARGQVSVSGLELIAGTPFSAPDVLVYWVQSVEDTTGIPRDATLLASLPDHGTVRFALPPAFLANSGYLILFSLPDARRVAAVHLPPSAPRSEATP